MCWLHCWWVFTPSIPRSSLMSRWPRFASPRSKTSTSPSWPPMRPLTATSSRARSSPPRPSSWPHRSTCADAAHRANRRTCMRTTCYGSKPVASVLAPCGCSRLPTRRSNTNWSCIPCCGPTMPTRCCARHWVARASPAPPWNWLPPTWPAAPWCACCPLGSPASSRFTPPCPAASSCPNGQGCSWTI